ncbi:GNAT family N-acetyltransferase [Deinococcus pimensis]|uniref:GNAT family N-acetyltransferase n=1 Tax=Deinococcus pimensis TaxID=309888 RepID=UPI00047F8498|nr:GNAT family N-acetyltransferase [Deinococcus pimensis]
MRPFTTAPTLHTPRLVLRAHTPDDFDDCLRLWTDASVTRFIGGRTSTPEDVWSRMLRYAGLWSLLGYGYWAVQDRVTGHFIGEVGLADFRRTLTPNVDVTPEGGWVLSPAAHGRGYATEALRAVLHWSDAHLARPDGLPTPTFCLIHPDNHASVRVAEKCGFQPIGRVSLGPHDSRLYRRSPRQAGQEAP